MLKRIATCTLKKGFSSKPLSQFDQPIALYFSRASYFSTKNSKKPKAVEKTSQRTTIADNEVELTKEKLQNIFQARERELEQLSKETKIPLGALLAVTLLTSPLLIGSGLVNYVALFDGSLSSYLPFMYNALMKYTGVHLFFMVIKDC